MKHILSLSLMAGLLVGCPDTDKYEQDTSTTPKPLPAVTQLLFHPVVKIRPQAA